MRKQNHVIYREIQKPRQIWAWVLVMLIALLFWYIFIQQILFGIPIGSKPAPDVILIIAWSLFGVIFPAVMIGFIKLITEVRKDGIYVLFMPFHFHYRNFLYKDIEDYESIDYDLSNFGGWGVRINLKGEKAYTMYGKQGIKLFLKNETVVIGTQKPNEIIKAIDLLTRKG
ncbi:DUF6141 family protein [Oceanobacillus alkalisoli]|uniref:DUF6141 family protein n=1 Tax=Oceanobacillus alkalisoli TaxID=2925113 RepID=UPI001F11BFB4|nr:DUF6141 family protein [Oceanobacillus alkalisoli]MCF3943793.1 DUF6141 family protein [Oceanobacillus alkalisoli]